MSRPMPERSRAVDVRWRGRAARRSACLLALAALAPAVTGAPRSIVDRSLLRTDVDLVGWDGSVVTYRDDLGRVREEPLGEILAILPIDARGVGALEIAPEALAAGGTPAVVELVDGQRLIGSLGPWDSDSVGRPGGAAEGDSVGVYSGLTGVRFVEIDRVSRLVIDPWSRGAARATAWTPGVDDEIVFRNGDRVAGFVLEVGESVLFDDGVDERRFDLDRVAEIRLGNEQDRGPAARIWHTGGEVRNLRSEAFETNGLLSLVGEQEGPGDPMRVSDVVAANVSGAALTPLAELEPLRVTPGGGRRWAAPPRVGSFASAPLRTPHVALPGPMRVEYRLPPGAERFGTVARLGGTLDRPRGEAGRWADAGVLVSVRTPSGETEVASVSLSRANPSASIAAALPGPGEVGRSLVIEVTPGRYGPVQDRVLLDRPMLWSPGEDVSSP
jgi:hypothetical protein